jgi:hypothetical protein
MKFLKGFALFILGSLLYLSLSTFGIAFMLNQTILNPDFVVSQVDRLDIPSLAEDMLSQQIPPEAEELEEFIGEAVSDTISDLEPWLKEQTAGAVNSLYDYLEGRSQSLSLVVPLEPVKESLRDNLWQAFLESPPPEVTGLSSTEIEQYFNEYYQQFSQEIPSTFELNETSLPPEGVALLGQVRQYIDYFNLIYNALIGLILLLILLIILVHREVRGSTRGIGVNFLTCGALSFLGVFAAEKFSAPLLTQANMPPYIQTWLPQLLSDTLAPLEIYSIVLAAVGVILLIVSFAYKPRQPALPL